jgi:RimJ/RimL family protein N-acetyltransferase
MVDLAKLQKRKLPFSYGTRRCRLVLSDSRYTREVVAMRNDQRLNRFIHHDELTPELHERFLEAELERSDAFNFVVLADDSFAGTVGLYAIGDETAEYGRFVMPEGGVRRLAPAVTLLCCSFGFEVLGLREIYCRILERNERVLRFHDRMGWKRDARHNEDVVFYGEQMGLVGFSLSLADWPGVFEAHSQLLSAVLAE